MKDVFYCYSFKMHLFLKSLGFRYIDFGTNKKSNTKYHTYEKSEKLDDAILLWNKIKHKCN